MKVLVCGGRDFKDKDLLWWALAPLNPEIIVTGGTPGADTLAADWAKYHERELRIYPAKWASHGKAAGPIRNQQMLDEEQPDIVLAMPGGKGTEDMCRRAMASHSIVYRVSR